MTWERGYFYLEFHRPHEGVRNPAVCDGRPFFTPNNVRAFWGHIGQRGELVKRGENWLRVWSEPDGQHEQTLEHIVLTVRGPGAVPLPVVFVQAEGSDEPCSTWLTVPSVDLWVRFWHVLQEMEGLNGPEPDTYDRMLELLERELAERRDAFNHCSWEGDRQSQGKETKP